MTPTGVRLSVITEKTAWIRCMIQGIRGLPLESLEVFRSDPRNPAAAESYLRRALEGLLDLGRHILAKGFGAAATEYKEVARQLVEHKVLTREEGQTMRTLAGYRNRLVHFYGEVSDTELYRICTEQIQDIPFVLDRLLDWVETHPSLVDRTA